MTENNVVALNDTAAFATGGMLPARTNASAALDMLRAHTEMMGAAHQIATVLVGTAMVPEIYRRKPDDAAAAILYGAELGLNPIQSLQQVFVVHGSPAIYSRTMAALLRSKGFRFQTDGSTAESVTVTGTAPNGETETVTWDIERARRAGYLTNKKYETDPQGMLYAKCLSEISRHLAPDVLLGMPYSREDLELDPAPVRVESERVSAAEVLASGGSDGGEVTVTQIKPDPESVPMATREQQKRLAGLFEEVGITERADKLEYLTLKLDREITAANQLTAEEADRAAAFLGAPGEPGSVAMGDETTGGAE